MENIKNIPVYKLDSASAAMYSEEDLFGRSLAANIECSRFLEDAVESSYLSELHHPDYDGAIDRAIEKFGATRVQYVIANAVLRRMHDGRIGQQYKDWAKDVCPAETASNANNRIFALSSLHSCYIHCLAMHAIEM